MAANLFLLAVLTITTFSLAIASDPSPLQDFCVGVKMSPVFVNGLVCEDPKLAKPEDFFFAGLDEPGNTSNPLGSMVTPVAAGQLGPEHPWHFPGPHRLRALRAQPAPHPPAGHRDPDGTRRLPLRRVRDVQSRQQTLRQGPSQGRRLRVPPGARALPAQLRGGRAVAIAALSSQNPGVITVANAVFGAKPPILDDVLAKAFKLDKKTVDWLQAQFWMDNN
ncbi:putative germin-like protein 8-7 isoform X1 [Iris pallida]|uniref:Germin-like protein 8-7 isoform X1 n=1 Tax=Iris pallida TaxID=29817 RepID=A0AAX6ENG2_IRIPA|nr:putative germin-like protein 8-7 isoform X1 [Iris pallida]